MKAGDDVEDGHVHDLDRLFSKRTIIASVNNNILDILEEVLIQFKRKSFYSLSLEEKRHIISLLKEAIGLTHQIRRTVGTFSTVVVEEKD